MTLKEKIQRKVDMIEYYRETNCDKKQFSEKFDVSPNLFYDVRKMSNDEEKFQELKARVNKKRSKYKRCVNKDEVKEWLLSGIDLLLKRGRTHAQIARTFGRKQEYIEELVGELNDRSSVNCINIDNTSIYDEEIKKEIEEHKNPKTNSDYKKGGD